MKLLFGIALFASALPCAVAIAFSREIPAPAAAAQQTSSPAASPQSTATSATPADADLTIHYNGPGVTAPELVPVNERFDPIDHCKKLDGKVAIIIAVDRSGLGHVVYYLNTKVPELYEMAKHVAESDRFKPGSAGGAPAVVGVADTMKLETCRTRNTLRLRSMPEQTLELVSAPEGAMASLEPPPGGFASSPAARGLAHIGKGVTPPSIIRQVAPEFSEAAREAKFQGVSLISITVDANGMPQNPTVVRPLGMGLDQKAIEAVKQFRFKPAMRNGTPVPVQITVEVNFRLY